MKYLMIMIATLVYTNIVSAQENLAQITCLTKTTGANASSLGQVFVFTQEAGTGVDGNALVNPNSEEYQTTIVTPNVSFQMRHYVETSGFVERFVKLNQPLPSQQNGINQLLNEVSENSVDRGPQHLVVAQRQQNGFGIGALNDNLGDGISLRFPELSDGSLTYNGSANVVSCHASVITSTPQSLALNEETLVENYQSAAVAN
jgi:hypothetical protein